jgi:hypothetical protein
MQAATVQLRLLQLLQTQWVFAAASSVGVLLYLTTMFVLVLQIRSSKNGTIELTALTEPLSVGVANRVQMLVSQLQDNVMYFAQVKSCEGSHVSCSSACRKSTCRNQLCTQLSCCFILLTVHMSMSLVLTDRAC